MSPTVMSQSVRNMGCDAQTPQVPMASLLTCQTPPSIENLVPGSQALSGCSRPSHPTGNLSRHIVGFPDGSDGKEAACSAGELGSIPGSGRSPRGGHGNPLQYSFLENPMDRGAWWATVHGGYKEPDTTERLSTAEGGSTTKSSLSTRGKLEASEALLMSMGSCSLPFFFTIINIIKTCV